jgi:DMSO/TMAO reductase YedYZ molybdopterin-dependent catalytic subunit
MADKISRRTLLTGVAATTGAAALAACAPFDAVTGSGVLQTAEGLTRATQRFFLSPSSMAKEFNEADISAYFRANGSVDPTEPDYVALATNGFADWRLKVGGLVERPLELSLADLRAMPSRTQITRHDCVEGWSCVGKWKGVPLAHVLNLAKLKPTARYIVFTCADHLVQTLDGTGRYYESHDLEDSFHPQTILAYQMNGETLPIAHGAPLRLRVERQLGYKMAKFIMTIDAVDSFAEIGRGKGGFWEDYAAYQWYAGI